MTVQRLRDTYGLSPKGEGKLVSTEVSWYRERTGTCGPYGERNLILTIPEFHASKVVA